MNEKLTRMQREALRHFAEKTHKIYVNLDIARALARKGFVVLTYTRARSGQSRVMSWDGTLTAKGREECRQLATA